MAPLSLNKNVNTPRSNRDDRAGEEENSTEPFSSEAAPSFGELMEAQNSVSRKRKRGSDTTTAQDAKLEALRNTLLQMRSESSKTKSETKERKRAARFTNSAEPANDQNGLNHDSDSAPSEEEVSTKSRTSKHAPMQMSSKHPVTRKRQVITVPKRVIRDPRFDPQLQHSAHPGDSEKAYSFLWDYRKVEIAELKAAIKQTRNEDDKETLKRTIASMENQVKAKEAKDRQQEVLRQHRKAEREQVNQGKTPYFLKQRDLKERASVEKFKGMKKKDQDKVIEKRRRREDQKEKKRMPEARRITGLRV